MFSARKMKFFFFSVIFNIPVLLTTSAQIESSYFQKSFIRTIQLHKLGWKMSYPLIQLNSNDQLVLSFDDMGEETNS
jgi:hypothetical protein